MKRTITCKAFWENAAATKHQISGGMAPAPSPPRTMTPKRKKGLCWSFTAQDLQAEMTRQQANIVDFKFCLNWHANEFTNEGPLWQKLQKYRGHEVPNTKEQLSA